MVPRSELDNKVVGIAARARYVVEDSSELDILAFKIGLGTAGILIEGWGSILRFVAAGIVVSDVAGGDWVLVGRLRRVQVVVGGSSVALHLVDSNLVEEICCWRCVRRESGRMVKEM